MAETNRIYNAFLKEYPMDEEKILKNSRYRYDFMENAQEVLYTKRRVSDFVKTVKPLQKMFNTILSILTFREKCRMQFLLFLRNQLIQRAIGSFDN